LPARCRACPLTPTDDFVNVDITRNPRDDRVDLIGGTLSFRHRLWHHHGVGQSFDHEIDFRFDSTPILLFFNVPVPAATVQPQSYESTMFEARFASELDGPFNFVGGAYYQRDDNSFEVRVPTTDGQGNGVAWDPPTRTTSSPAERRSSAASARTKSIQTALFGEFSYTFLDKWEALVGARSFSVDVKSVQQTTHNFGGQSARWRAGRSA
jgi:iron complex outermembrane recepter protein